MTCDDVFDVLTRGPFPSGAAEQDEHVERHLVGCQECRRLATALRPAVELFQEAIDPAESLGLPGYRGRVALPGADDMLEHCQDAAADHAGLAGAGWRPAWVRADAAARRYGARPAPRASQANVGGEPSASFVRRVASARSNLLRFAAAVLLGVAAASGARELMTRQATSTDFPRGPVAPTLVQAAQPADNGDKPQLAWLASLALPATCVPRFPSEPSRAVKSVTGNSLGGVQLASADAGRFACCTDCHSSARQGGLSPAGRSIVAQACTACH